MEELKTKNVLTDGNFTIKVTKVLIESHTCKCGSVLVRKNGAIISEVKCPCEFPKLNPFI